MFETNVQTRPANKNFHDFQRYPVAKQQAFLSNLHLARFWSFSFRIQVGCFLWPTKTQTQSFVLRKICVLCKPHYFGSRLRHPRKAQKYPKSFNSILCGEISHIPSLMLTKLFYGIYANIFAIRMKKIDIKLNSINVIRRCRVSTIYSS